MARFNQITIIGLGLMGGSLGMALRRRRLAQTVVGFSRKPSTLRRAKACGAIDAGTSDLMRAAQHADLVILATPVETIVPYAKRLARFMRAGGVLTDVGSSKHQIVLALERAMPRRVAFVGAHPLAGSEQRGLDAARADLFDDSLCVVTATRRTDRRALRIIGRLWKPLVGRVIVMDPQRHDRLLAAVSHVPHVLAFCLINAAADEALAVAPRSFLDATRVAKSNPELWDDIFLSNRSALLAAMGRFERQWRTVRHILARADRRALRRFLKSAHAKRHALDTRDT